MKTLQMPTWLTRTLLVGLATIFVLMPFHAFISTWGGTAIGPLWIWKSWKELLLVGLVVMVLAWLLRNPVVIKDLSRQRLARLIVAYIAVTVTVTAVLLPGLESDAVAAGLAMNLRYLGVGALAYLLLRYGRLGERWFERMGWYVIGIGVFVSLLGIAQAFILPADFLTQFGYGSQTIAPATLIDDDPSYRRAFATLRGPNDFGAFLILPMLLLIVRRSAVPIAIFISGLGAMFWALLLSSSRSAWIGLLVALFVLVFIKARHKLSWKVVTGVVCGLVVAGAIALYAAINVPVLRMAIFHSSPGDPSLTEGSTDSHLAATLGGVQRVATQPLGCGVGCAGPASYYGDDARISENYLVQIAEEVGVLGAIIFVALVGYVGYRLARVKVGNYLGPALVAALGGYVAIGMLLHVWADDPVSITWWLLAGAVLGYNDGNTWIKSKNNSHSRT